MPRPLKERWVEFLPEITRFQPAGVPPAAIEEVRLTVDELEALRLKDLEGLDQTAAARRMNLAQSTFQRILTAARGKLTRALVEGRALRIEGGAYRVVAGKAECGDCGHTWRRVPPAGCPACGGSPILSPNLAPGGKG